MKDAKSETLALARRFMKDCAQANAYQADRLQSQMFGLELLATLMLWTDVEQELSLWRKEFHRRYETARSGPSNPNDSDVAFNQENYK